MNGNTTPTVISTTGVFTKVLGTTTAGPVNEKFTHSTGRLTYNGTVTKIYFKEKDQIEIGESTVDVSKE